MGLVGTPCCWRQTAPRLSPLFVSVYLQLICVRSPAVWIHEKLRHLAVSMSVCGFCLALWTTVRECLSLLLLSGYFEKAGDTAAALEFIYVYFHLLGMQQ